MTAILPNARNRRVFDSVFGGPVLSQPTPVATPATNFTAPGKAFGVLAAPPGRQNLLSDARTPPRGAAPVSSQPSQVNTVGDQIRWDRSWHSVTHALQLPDLPLGENLNPVATLEAQEKVVFSRDESDRFRDALEDLMDPVMKVPYASHTEDVMAWHDKQVRVHFLRQVLPQLVSIKHLPNPEELLSKVIDLLHAAGRLYMKKFALITDSLTPAQRSSSLQSFERDLSAIISNSITPLLTPSLPTILKSYIYHILAVPTSSRGTVFGKEDPNTKASRQKLRTLISHLKSVGLAGEPFEITFAEIMNAAMTNYVSIGCSGIWSDEDPRIINSARIPHSVLPRTARHSAPSRCVLALCDWIENRYAKLAVQVLSELQSNNSLVTLAQLEKWKEMGLSHLAALRSAELFDIVGHWPATKAALDDLRTSITTPQRRLHLTDVFAEALNKKLLHPGASTLQILQTYIAMISSFHSLDASKVLLDRVAYPLQVYLCSREDTVRVIITGLLAEPPDPALGNQAHASDKLYELAELLNHGEDQLGSRANDDELDWHDMEWMPDPVDAGPGYKRSKSADIIGTLIGVLGSQDVFIKEFQSVMGDNLLKHSGAFEREIKVLELLKVRFGEAPLQSCEVMLKDIQDSGKVNKAIREEQHLDPTVVEIRAANEILREEVDEAVLENLSPEGLLRPSLNAKILSRLFWPQLQEESFQVPRVIADLQATYDRGFQEIKESRKLTWLQSLGQVTVELELTDRTIVEEVHTWQATIIWAFQGEDGSDVKRSVQELMEHLEMDEGLVRSALKFWVNKIVLQEVSKDVFAVLETLNQEDRARSNAQSAATAAATMDDSVEESTLSTNDSIPREKREIYWKFVQGMLKNASSQMPLAQIGMMLSMLVPDNFPHTNEELQELLGERVGKGDLEFAGGKYRLKK